MASAAIPRESHPNPETRLQTRNSIAKASDKIKYMIDPTHGPRPINLRSRTLLRSLRYIAIFAFWRLVRYAKYAAVGAIVAAVSGTVIGSVASGAAFIVAPTGLVGGATMGLVWAVARFGFRRARSRLDRRGERVGDDPRADESADAREAEGRSAISSRVEPW